MAKYFMKTTAKTFRKSPDVGQWRALVVSTILCLQVAAVYGQDGQYTSPEPEPEPEPDGSQQGEGPGVLYMKDDSSVIVTPTCHQMGPANNMSFPFLYNYNINISSSTTSYYTCTIQALFAGNMSDISSNLVVMNSTQHQGSYVDYYKERLALGHMNNPNITSYLNCTKQLLKDLPVTFPNVTAIDFCNIHIYYSSASAHSVESGSNLTCGDVLLQLSHANTSLRSESLSIRTSLTHVCSSPAVITYKWLMYNNTCTNCTSPVYESCEAVATTRDLTLPPLSLEYGHYKFVLRITFQLDPEPQQQAVFGRNITTFMEVVASPLVARLMGGSARVQGSGDAITVNGSASYDPDQPSTSGLMYTWYCYIYSGSEIPTDQLASNTSSTVGCQAGLGYSLSQVSPEPWLLSLNFSHASSLLPVTYRFVLVVSNSLGASATVWQDVRVVEGTPPLVEIRCIRNCETYITSGEKLALEAACSNCGNTTQLNYTWSFTPASDIHTLDTIDWTTTSSTGGAQSLLVLLAGVFSGVSTTLEEVYTLGVNVSRVGEEEPGGVAGEAVYTVRTNPAPHSGTCSVTPSEGEVLLTTFTLSCTGFIDSHTPLTYRYSTQVGSGGGRLLGTGGDTLSTMLPLGDKDSDYSLTLLYQVQDKLGAVTSPAASTVTVIPAATMEVESISLTQIENSNGMSLDTMVASGNVEEATVIMSSVSSLLNKPSTDSTDTSQKQAQRTQMREQMINYITTLTTDSSMSNSQSLDQLQQTTALMSDVTKVKEELSSTARSTVATTLLTMATILNTSSSTASEEAKVETGRLMVAGVSNLLDSTTTADTASSQEEGELRKAATLNSLAAVEQIKAALVGDKLVGETATTLVSDSVSIHLQRATQTQLTESPIQVTTAGTSDTHVRNEIHLPAAALEFSVSDEDIGVEIVQYSKNPFFWSTNTSGRVSSSVSDLNLKDAGGGSLSLHALSPPMDLFLPQQVELSSPTPLSLSPASPLYLTFTLSHSDSAALLLVLPDSEGQVQQEQLQLEVSQISEDSVNKTFTEQVLESVRVGEVLLTAPLTLPTQAHNSLLMEAQTLLPPAAYVARVSASQQMTLNIAVVEASCLYWNVTREVWSSEGCLVGNLTTLHFTHCQCSHLTSFASSVLVPPNNLDLLKSMAQFLTFWKNPVVLSLVVCLLLVYCLLAVWARRTDKKYFNRLDPLELEDNHLLDRYPYAVTIYTGRSASSATTATPAIRLIGKRGRSSPHLLTCTSYKLFQSGSNDLFILRTRDSLGDLLAVDLWHDNSGDAPSWYVSRVLVQDLTTGEIYHFACHCWLSDKHSEGQTFPLTQPEAVHKYLHRFRQMADVSIKDEHVFVSVYTCPIRSPFTRLQRLSVCLTILFSEMLCSIMFYRDDDYQSDKPSMQVLGFSFSLEEFIIGLETALLVLPLDLMVVKFFMESQGLPKDKKYFPAVKRMYEAFQHVLAAAPLAHINTLGTGVEVVQLEGGAEEGKLQEEGRREKQPSDGQVEEDERRGKQINGGEERKQTEKTVEVVKDMDRTYQEKDEKYRKEKQEQISIVHHDKKTTNEGRSKGPDKVVGRAKEKGENSTGKEEHGEGEQESSRDSDSEAEFDFNTDEAPPLYDEYVSGRLLYRSITIPHFQQKQVKEKEKLMKSDVQLTPAKPQPFPSSHVLCREDMFASKEKVYYSFRVPSEDILQLLGEDGCHTPIHLHREQMESVAHSVNTGEQAHSSREQGQDRGSNQGRSRKGNKNNSNTSDLCSQCAQTRPDTNTNINNNAAVNPCTGGTDSKPKGSDSKAGGSELRTDSTNGASETKSRVNSAKHRADSTSIEETEEELLMAALRRYYNRAVRKECRSLGLSLRVKGVLLVTAWVLLVLMVAASGFFTVLYSFEYGLLISTKWLKSTLVALCTDLILLEPTKALVMAAVLSLLMKKPSDDLELNAAKVWLPETMPTLTAGLVAEANDKWETERQESAYLPSNIDIEASNLEIHIS